MKKRSTKTKTETGLGILPDDRVTLRRFLEELGWSQPTLAKKANLSQPMLNQFFNGHRNLSAAATERVMTALQIGQLEKKTADESRRAYEAYVEVNDAIAPKDARGAREVLLAMSAAPAPALVAQWKAKQIELLSAASELRVERERNAELEKELSAMREVNSSHKKIISNLEEVASLYKAWVGRLKQQILDAGLTPSD